MLTRIQPGRLIVLNRHGYRVSEPPPPMTVREMRMDRAMTWKLLHRFLRLPYQTYK